MEGDTEISSASLLREVATGSLGLEDNPLSPITGLVDDDDVRRVLLSRAELYSAARAKRLGATDPPASYWQTDEAERIIKQHGTDVATTALENGNLEIIDFISGIPNFESDISGLRAIDTLSDWITRGPGAISLLSGHMGSGKTDFALLLAEIYSWAIDDDLEVCSNITSVRKATTVTSMSGLVDKLDTPKRTLMVFDEASSHASGYSGDRQDVEDQLRQLLRYTRKRRGDMIVIGHAEGGADIHPELRRLSQAIYKESKKKATIYKTIKKRDYVGKIDEISGIPPTSWDFDTLEESTWSWDMEDTDISSQADDDDSNSDDGPTAPVDRCIAAKADGSRCGVTRPGMIDRAGFCVNHSAAASDVADSVTQDELNAVDSDDQEDQEDQED